MRVLHISSWFQPGLGYSEYHLPNAQRNLGHDVAVLTSDRYFRFPNYEATVQQVLGERIVGTGDRIERGIQAFRLPVLFEFRHHIFLRRFNRCLDRFRPDVVHVHEAFTIPALQSAAAKTGRKVKLLLASSMEPDVFYPQAGVRKLYYQFHRVLAAPLLRRRVDLFTAVGTGAKAIVERQIGLAPASVEVIPLGADSDAFRPNPVARVQIRRALGIPEEAIVFIYAGKLIRDKDVHVLARAFASRPARSGYLVLLGNGTPEYRSELLAILGGCADQVRFVPAVPNADLPGYFAAADVGIWPSQTSNAALEGAMTGLPIVVNDAPGVAHYVAGRNGLAFPRGDASALAGVLAQLAEDPARRTELGANGRKLGVETLSWRAIAARYLALYSGSADRL